MQSDVELQARLLVGKERPSRFLQELQPKVGPLYGMLQTQLQVLAVLDRNPETEAACELQSVEVVHRTHEHRIFTFQMRPSADAVPSFSTLSTGNAPEDSGQKTATSNFVVGRSPVQLHDDSADSVLTVVEDVGKPSFRVTAEVLAPPSIFIPQVTAQSSVPSSSQPVLTSYRAAVASQ